MTNMTQAVAYVRTEAGKAEIRAHGLPLSRPARNLLHVIDASCSGEAWIAKVHGSTADDLARLVAARLVVRVSGGASRTVHQRVSVDTALRDWTYAALYELLTREAREQFGLIKGYRMILQIEGCADLAGMQELALKFVEHIRKVHGEDAATRFRKQLGATE